MVYDNELLVIDDYSVINYLINYNLIENMSKGDVKNCAIIDDT